MASAFTGVRQLAHKQAGNYVYGQDINVFYKKYKNQERRGEIMKIIRDTARIKKKHNKNGAGCGCGCKNGAGCQCGTSLTGKKKHNRRNGTGCGCSC